MSATGMVEPNPLREVGGGTLFLDRLERLPARAQQQLLILARCIQDGLGAEANPMPARLAAGSAALLLDDSPTVIAPELLDYLDKIPVEVGRGVAAEALKRAAEAGNESGPDGTFTGPRWGLQSRGLDLGVGALSLVNGGSASERIPSLPRAPFGSMQLRSRRGRPEARGAPDDPESGSVRMVAGSPEALGVWPMLPGAAIRCSPRPADRS